MYRLSVPNPNIYKTVNFNVCLLIVTWHEDLKRLMIGLNVMGRGLKTRLLTLEEYITSFVLMSVF